MPIERIAAFIRGESGDSFEELALQVFRFEYERSAPFRQLCDRRQATPRQISEWRQVPAVPAPDPSRPGSTPGDPDEDRLGDLQAAVADRSLPAALFAGMGRPPILSLVPSDEDPNAPGAGAALDHPWRERAAADSLVAAGRRGVEVARARSFLAARQRDRRPTLILATAATLAQLLESLERRGLLFRLPPGSRVVETGARGPGNRELLTRLAEGLAVPPEGVLREYGLGGLPTHFYAGHDDSGEPQPFRPPAWTRVRVLDPRTLAEAPPGAAGSITIFDLAALGSPPHLLTADTGSVGEDGFRLLAAG